MVATTYSTGTYSVAWMPDSASVTAPMPDVITYIIRVMRDDPVDAEAVANMIARAPLPRPVIAERVPSHCRTQHRPPHRVLHRRVR